MSTIPEQKTEDVWPKFGETFIGGLRIAMILSEAIFAAILSISALGLLGYGIIWIVAWIGASYERWHNRKQLKQGSDEEVVVGTIASGGNERDVQYAFLKPRGGK